MNIKLALLPIFVLLFLSCEEDNVSDIICEDPIEGKGWLESKIQELEESDSDSDLARYFYISQAQYKGVNIIIFANCCPICDTVIKAYNCEGDYVGRLGCREEDINFSVLDAGVIIWKPDNFSCAEAGNFRC